MCPGATLKVSNDYFFFFQLPLWHLNNVKPILLGCRIKSFDVAENHEINSLQLDMSSKEMGFRTHLTEGSWATALMHCGWDKMADILQRTFSTALSWMKIFELWSKFKWILFLRVQLTVSQHWLRWGLDAGLATSHFLNEWWFILGMVNMHHCASIN